MKISVCEIPERRTVEPKKRKTRILTERKNGRRRRGRRGASDFWGMKLFWKKEGRRNVFLAPVTGECIPLEQVKDEAFASGMCGGGIAILPSEGTFRSPVDGVVTGIAESKHAYTLTSRDGLEILIHIGIDTVSLRGEGFVAKVGEGENVRAGDVLCEADLERIRVGGFDTTSPALISNIEEVARSRFFTGRVRGGVDAVIEYEF